MYCDGVECSDYIICTTKKVSFCSVWNAQCQLYFGSYQITLVSLLLSS